VPEPEEHFFLKASIVENLLKWTFVYGRKPHLWKDSYLRDSGDWPSET
jgi:hypothetical protein